MNWYKQQVTAAPPEIFMPRDKEIKT
jgi:hypothetical protein